MFEAAVSKFVKAVGKESLVAVPNLDEANRCRPFQVIVKKNRRWFWQSPTYESTPFQLHQLLTPSDEIADVKVNSRKLTTYDKTYAFDVSGKTGGKLVQVFDVELDGSDTISVDSKFGDITKLEVDLPTLLSKVDARKLDMKHEFVEQVRQNPRKVLCVVVGTAQVAADATVHMHVDRKGEAKEDAGKIVSKVTDEEVDVAVDDKGDKDMVIPAGTPLAFNVCELCVWGDGALELMVEKNSLGGFKDMSDSVDGAANEAILECMSLKEQFAALLKLDDMQREDLASAVLNICTTPADVETLLHELKVAQRSAGSQEAQRGTLKVKGQMADSQHVLQLAGFQVEENGALVYPAEDTAILDGIRSLFEALMELDDNETAALSKCNKNHAPALFHLLNSTLNQSEVKTSDPEVVAIFKEPNAAQAFTQTLGFQVTNDKKLTAADDNQAELEGACCVVYALWLDADKPASSSAFRCAIL